MDETKDGVLTIIPGDVKKKESEILLNITKEMTSDEIYYKILREYINGYKKIVLFGNLSDEQMDFLQIINKRIVGLEVTEQKKDRIVISDLLNQEDIDIDKIIDQMFSFIIAMTNDIIIHIDEERSPGDKILDRDSVTTRSYNLAYRCCVTALKDSLYLGKLKKNTHEILIISRIIRYLDMIGTILVGVSYLINKEPTPGMKKYHYSVFEKDVKLDKILGKYLKKWLKYFGSIKRALKDKKISEATKLYIDRFNFRLDSSDLDPGEYSTSIIDLTEQLNRMSSLILRDFMMY